VSVWENELVQVGRSVPVTTAQAADLAAVLTAARRGHPWPDEIGPGRWRKPGTTVPLTKVERAGTTSADTARLPCSPVMV